MHITEATHTQFPMIRLAAETGWAPVSPQDALASLYTLTDCLSEKSGVKRSLKDCSEEMILRLRGRIGGELNILNIIFPL